jgi:hypothetical protein
MSRKPRWHPPHNDVTDTPVSTARQRAGGQFGSVFAKCVWPGCKDYEEPNYQLKLCGGHLLHVRSKARAYDDETDALHERFIAETTAKREATAEKIDAGIRVTKGDRIPGWVYYLQVDDTIKIGYARDVPSRMRAYPPSAKLLAVEPGTPKLERQRHDHFNAYLAHGREWFLDRPELRAWIATLITEYGKPTAHEYRYTTPQSKQVTVPKGYRGHKKTAA